MNHEGIELLQNLLSAERAGCRVAMESLAQARDEMTRSLLQRILEGEGSSCRHLLTCLQHLGEEPNRETSDFYERSMAISDLNERLAFVERGQRWVIRKLEAFLPTCEDAVLQHELGEMLRIHHENSEAASAS